MDRTRREYFISMNLTVRDEMREISVRVGIGGKMIAKDAVWGYVSWDERCK